jgi:soluble lytic murein transglycosylase-like protein
MKPPWCAGGARADFDSYWVREAAAAVRSVPAAQGKEHGEVSMDSISQVIARVHQIQSLLGEPSGTNTEFGSELQRAAESHPREAARASSNDGKGQSRTPAGTLAPLIAAAAGRTGLSEDLISAVIATESGYRPDAVSRTGAAGLMQLMPGTARALGVDDPFDPSQNIMGGAEYLRQQLNRFGTVEKALAAYNAGPGAVERHHGIPPFAETQNYVQRVLNHLRRSVDRRNGL